MKKYLVKGTLHIAFAWQGSKRYYFKLRSSITRSLVLEASSLDRYRAYI